MKEKQIDIEVIKNILAKKGMTIQDLAEKLGKERSVVYKTITNGNPTLGFVMALSKVLEMPVEALVSTDTELLDPEKKTEIDGFVEVNGETYRIRTKDDLEELYNRLCKSL